MWEMCLPRLRWTLQQSLHSNTPRLIEAQLGSAVTTVQMNSRVCKNTTTIIVVVFLHTLLATYCYSSGTVVCLSIIIIDKHTTVPEL